MVSDLICAIGVRDVDLNDHQVGRVLEIELLDVFVLQRDVEVRIEISREGSQTQGREERILDWPPVWARGLSQRWQNQLDASERSFGVQRDLPPRAVPTS